MEKKTKTEQEAQGAKTETRKASKLTMLKSILTLEGHLSKEEETPPAVIEALDRIKNWLRKEVLGDLGL